MHEGGCDCRGIRYRFRSDPIVVHCCHCRWCQRETGSAFALNAVIEADRVEILAGTPERIDTPSASGRGQPIFRCPECKVALWSHYGSAAEKAKFVRVGTFDNPDALPPDVHIFTASKQPWVSLPKDARVFDVFYSEEDAVAIYGQDGINRWRSLLQAET
ncbi:GFA family protein [Notoacmeibacter sp. MSK16QG-6]|uniref:GFA family protein n=1 Tax=Notoacmeibacter sp. MSK16QG-6 TaxID=2957982 RepID=UPI00209D3249|nr:GFA family protein [Notoacmeibacter sp. MSK16QG-6]MCP1199769.1 GFA family protein [Notoacmeibacter sp. MSK16QG-6]